MTEPVPGAIEHLSEMASGPSPLQFVGHHDDVKHSVGV